MGARSGIVALAVCALAASALAACKFTPPSGTELPDDAASGTDGPLQPDGPPPPIDAPASSCTVCTPGDVMSCSECPAGHPVTCPGYRECTAACQWGPCLEYTCAPQVCQ